MLPGQMGPEAIYSPSQDFEFASHPGSGAVGRFHHEYNSLTGCSNQVGLLINLPGQCHQFSSAGGRATVGLSAWALLQAEL